MVDKIATQRVDGSARTQSDTFNREFDIYWWLKPHTRERPKEENQWQLDRENRSPIRSDAGARTAGKMLAKALDEYQREQYGQTENGAPRGPPSAEHFPGWTAKGRERKRVRLITKTIEHWRSAIAPNLLREIRQAIIPIEVKFRRELARQREADKRTAEARHRQASTQMNAARGRPPERN